ncbi:MAG: hypothetical protein P8P46_13605 [Alphaproteobacteria bacterium]|nr:hypothetical protein [Alphaproteobacteria bacterium]
MASIKIGSIQHYGEVSVPLTPFDAEAFCSASPAIAAVLWVW